MENEILYQYLSDLGNVVPLDIWMDSDNFTSEIERFREHWVRYNPRKNVNRWGLSLFSLDGGLSGIPDLDSIREYNQERGTALGEMSFNTPTKAFRDLNSINKKIEPFIPYLGRSHLIRLDQGGFFPPHRDVKGINPDSFRLFAFMRGCDRDKVNFTLDDQRLKLPNGQLVLFNSRLDHHIFSFVDNVIFLVLNVKLCKESIQLVLNNLASK